MIPLNVSFGIFAFMPKGWIFMAFVILIESILLSKFLRKRWLDKKTVKTVFASNAISGFIGIVISMFMNGGWWLVVWFPWVSDHEVNTSNNQTMQWLYIYYACAFILTILIECLVNWLILRKSDLPKKVIMGTLYANCISYLVGTVVLYSYSFG